MAEVMIALAVAKTGLSLLGQRSADKAQQAQAKADAAGLRYEADALDQKAGQERAISQHKAQEEARKAERLLSTQQARFAASGGGFAGSGDTIMAKTAEKGQFNQDLELWGGETAGRGLEQQAKLKRVGASHTLAVDKARRKTMPLQYASTIVSGAASVAAAGADAGYWKPPADASWTQTTKNGSGDILHEEQFGGSRYRYG